MNKKPLSGYMLLLLKLLKNLVYYLMKKRVRNNRMGYVLATPAVVSVPTIAVRLRDCFGEAEPL
jgi:hypothetical protein